MSTSDFPEMAAELADGLAAEYHRAVAVDPRLRRLQRTLADLGLPLPADWVQYGVDENGAECLTFAPITWATAQRLVASLEDLAARRSSSTHSGGATPQPSLMAPDPCPSPQLLTPDRPSTVHMEVPR